MCNDYENSSYFLPTDVETAKYKTMGNGYVNNRMCKYSDNEHSNTYLASSDADLPAYQEEQKSVVQLHSSGIKYEIPIEEDEWLNYIGSNPDATNGEPLSAAFLVEPLSENTPFVPHESYDSARSIKPQSTDEHVPYPYNSGDVYITPQSLSTEYKFSPRQLPLLCETDPDTLNQMVDPENGCLHEYDGKQQNGQQQQQPQYSSKQSKLECPVANPLPTPRYQIKVLPNLFTKVGASLAADGTDLVFHEAYGICRRDQFPSSEFTEIPAFFNTDVPTMGKTCEQTMFEERSRDYQILTRFTQTKYGTCRILPKPKYIRRIKDMNNGKFLSLDFRQRTGQYFTK